MSASAEQSSSLSLTQRSQSNQNKGSNGKTNILRKFKFEQTMFDHPKSLSNFRSTSLQNSVKELEETFAKLQDKMVEFYFFLNSQKVPKVTSVDREKERYLKMPIMLVFDYLKGFFFKVQNENEELRHKIEKIQQGELYNDLFKSNAGGNPYSQENETYIKELKTSIEKLQWENQKFKMEFEKNVKELNDYKVSKKQAVDTSSIIIQEIQKDNERLIKVIEDKNGQIELQKKDIQDRDITIEKLKEKLVDSSKLQHKIKLLEAKYVADINQVKTQKEKEEEGKKKEGEKQSKLLALNSVKEEKIQFLENEVRSFRDRVSTERQSLSQLSKLAHRAEMNEKISRKSEHEIARLKIRIEEKDRFIEKLKKDFERVFDELKKLKKEMERTNKYDSAQSIQGLAQGQNFGMSSTLSQASIPYVPADKNPYVLEEYQKRVREQESVISGMRKKFKKMNLTEKKGYVKQKEFEMQRFDYERQIQDLKRVVEDKQGTRMNYDTDSSLDEKANHGAMNFFNTISQKQGSTTQRSLKSAIQNKDNLLFSNNENLKAYKESRASAGSNYPSDLIFERIKNKVQPGGNSIKNAFIKRMKQQF